MWRHASSSTSRGAEAKYQGSGWSALTDFWIDVVRPSAILEGAAATL